VWRRAALSKAAREGFWSVKATAYAMPRSRSVDIDTAEDFEWAQWLSLRQRPEPEQT
jgi:CMP-N,N'-diacetyllegionaminic acid synthase